MVITFLGHAGFIVETPTTIIIADPWLNKTGAFEGGWFQFPRNHHLDQLVKDKLSETGKQKFIYISHEHKDHFDRPFLNTLVDYSFSFVIPRYRRDHFYKEVKELYPQPILLMEDGQKLP